MMDGTGTDSIVNLQAGNGGEIALPEGVSLTNAEFSQDGSDLVLTMPDGSQVKIEGYFDQPNPPQLVSADGAQVPGNVVAQLAGGPGLQAGDATGSDALTGGADGAISLGPSDGKVIVGSDGAPIGQVQNLAGTVFAVRVDGTRVQLQVGDQVFQGDVLESGADGSIGVMLADQTTFSMGENGKMVLDEMIYDPAAQKGSVSMSVVQGVFTFVSGQVAKTDPDAMALKTPVATIGIRGTQVGLDLSPGQPMQVVLMEEKDGFVGEVVIANAGGVRVMNNASDFTTVASFNTVAATVTTIATSQIINTFGSALKAIPSGKSQNDFGIQKEGLQKTLEKAIQDDKASGKIDAEKAAALEKAAAQAAAEAAAKAAAEAAAQAAAKAAAEAAAKAAAEAAEAARRAAEQARIEADPFSGIGSTWTRSFASAGALDAADGKADGQLDLSLATRPLKITGTAGDDIIKAGSGDDYIDGGAGNDEIYGGAGGDKRLDGGVGDDTIEGGAGNDTIIGGEGSDWVIYTDAAKGVTVNLAAGRAFGAGIGEDTLSGIENVRGGSGNDTITGDGGANILEGGAGDDTLRGGGGDDVLIGGLGNDRLEGGAGSDIIMGGDGFDTAVFSGNLENYTITIGADGVLVVTGPGGVADTVSGVEMLDFADIDLDANDRTAVGVDFTVGDNTLDVLEDARDIPLDTSARLFDADGSETLSSITIAGVPKGATLSAGTHNPDGTWTLSADQLEGLTLTLAPNSDQDLTLTVSASSTEKVGGAITHSSTSINVSVAGVADTPDLTVKTASGAEDQAIPLDITAALTDIDPTDATPEELSVVISGVPKDAKLSLGTDNGDGTWTLSGADLAKLSTLTITPPANSSDDFTLTVTATSSEDGTSASTVAQLNVEVTGVADVPSVTVQNATGLEDQPIALNITAALNDPTGESLSVTIAGVPAGATLSAGTSALQPDGTYTWTLEPGQLNGLTIKPAPNSDADFTLKVTATSTEEGTSAQTVADLNVTVRGVADVPTVNIVPTTIVVTSGVVSYALDITGGLTDTDGSESLLYQVTGLPQGATLSAGTFNATDGTWTLTPSQLAGLNLNVNGNVSEDFTLTVRAVSSEDGTVASSVDTVFIDVPAPAPSGETITGTSSSNILIGGSGHDTITGGTGGEDFLYGGDGNDTLRASTDSRDDRLIGGAGDDKLYGGDNSGDLLVGGSGNDEAWGGGGNDMYVFRQGEGNDTFHGGGGTDQIVLVGPNGIITDFSQVTITMTSGSYSRSGSTVTFTGTAPAGYITMADGSRLTFDGVEKLQLRSDVSFDDNFEVVYGPTSSGHDDDDVHGDDVDGNYFGGAGNDYLSGGSGSDILRGGEGDDILSGGSGGDTFIFDAQAGKDIITDISGQDKIVFEGAEFNAQDMIFSENNDGDVVVSFRGAPNTSVTLDGVSMNDLNLNDNNASNNGYSVTQSDGKVTLTVNPEND